MMLAMHIDRRNPPQFQMKPNKPTSIWTDEQIRLGHAEDLSQFGGQRGWAGCMKPFSTGT